LRLSHDTPIAKYVSIEAYPIQAGDYTPSVAAAKLKKDFSKSALNLLHNPERKRGSLFKDNRYDTDDDYDNERQEFKKQHREDMYEHGVQLTKELSDYQDNSNDPDICERLNAYLNTAISLQLQGQAIPHDDHNKYAFYTSGKLHCPSKEITLQVLMIIVTSQELSSMNIVKSCDTISKSTFLIHS
jgi:hypothetical protein